MHWQASAFQISNTSLFPILSIGDKTQRQSHNYVECIIINSFLSTYAVLVSLLSLIPLFLVSYTPDDMATISIGRPIPHIICRYAYAYIIMCSITHFNLWLLFLYMQQLLLATIKYILLY